MSETQNVPQDATGATETDAGTQWMPEDPENATEPQPEPTPDDDANPNREAAKYRVKLRETEAERDTLRGQLEASQRAFAEHLASADGLKPEALWASGVDLADLLADDGRPDAAKVAEAVESARDKLGIRKGPKVNPAQGTSGSTPPASTKHDPGNAWQELLRGGR